jgi:hypothetical protein
MAADDYNMYNMPALLSTSVTCPDPKDPNKWIRDESWYVSIRQMYFALFKFFQDHGLSNALAVRELADTDKVVLKFSDFTPEGQAFVKSGADDRWLASFDRPGSKKSWDDVRYLEKQLAKLREGSSLKDGKAK